MTSLFRILGPLIPFMLLGQQATKPAVPLLQAEPTDSSERLRREARSKWYNFPGQPLPLTLGEGREYHQVIIATPSRLPELPVAESDEVVAGQVTDLKVFPSVKKNAIYTEYTFLVQRIGKTKSGIIPGNQIAILRIGGTAKVPNGGVLRFELQENGPDLIIGGKYLMFLTSLLPQTDAFAIVRYWNIEGDSVTPAYGVDIARVQQGKSLANNKSLDEVLSMVLSGK